MKYSPNKFVPDGRTSGRTNSRTENAKSISLRLRRGILIFKSVYNKITVLSNKWWFMVSTDMKIFDDKKCTCGRMTYWNAKWPSRSVNVWLVKKFCMIKLARTSFRPTFIFGTLAFCCAFTWLPAELLDNTINVKYSVVILMFNIISIKLNEHRIYV